MSVLDVLHGEIVHGRRVRILSRRLTELLPENGRVLDVGSGDGLLGRLIMESRPDIELRGIDVSVRSHTHIPVDVFDGRVMPYRDGSFDVVLLVDVLHHTTEPMSLLNEAVRVARKSIVIKDHTAEGLIDNMTLCFMDWVGNVRHGVALPYNYWPLQKWLEAFDKLAVTISEFKTDLHLYPRPASWIFDRSLHFVARLDRIERGTKQC